MPKNIKKFAPKKKQQQYLIPMLKRSLDLLQLLAVSQDGGMSLSELARALDAPKSSIFKILSTLGGEGFVSKDSQTEKYQVTPKLFGLANTASRRLDLKHELYPFLKELKDKTGETINLGVLQGKTAIYVETLEGPGPVKVVVQPGKQLALHSTALGKSLLAFLAETEIDQILTESPLEAFTPNTCTDPTMLKQDLASVRRQGYALDLEEDSLDMCCIGAPIRDYTGGVVAAVSLTAPSYRFPRSAVKSTARIIVEASERMSRWLGYSGADSVH